MTRWLCTNFQWQWCLVLLVFFLGGCAETYTPGQLPGTMIRGAWVAKNDTEPVLGTPTTSTTQKMKAVGIRWVAIGPEVTMLDVTKPVMTFGEDDEDYRKYIRHARKQGMDVFLMPRIESPSFFKPPFPFRADIAMKTEKDRDTFYANYLKMLLHYGKMAQEEGVAMFGIGLEYRKLVKTSPQRWRDMIKEVRKVYKGKLTYSANWYLEYEEVTFWDALDTIGIGAYFEIGDGPNNHLNFLIYRWRPIVARLRALSKKVNRPVLFTEIGYTAFHDAARFPWKWQDDLDRPVNTEHQADCLRAAFYVFSQEPWFQGFLLWRIYTDSSDRPQADYHLLGKPSEKVIQEWFAMP